MKIAFITIAFALLAACSDSARYAESSTQISQRATESNMQRLIAAIPPPQLATSGERKNLVRRLERLNTENMSGYIYLLNYGSVVAFYPIAGKVTSLNAYLSGEEQLINDPHGDLSAGSASVESPDFDGAYGKNSDGIFFFTADTDAYVEWHGDYLFSDQPLHLSQQPIMIRDMTAQ